MLFNLLEAHGKEALVLKAYHRHVRTFQKDNRVTRTEYSSQERASSREQDSSPPPRDVGSHRQAAFDYHAVPTGSVDFTVLCEGPIGCDGIPNSGLAYDECDVCGGDGSTCDLRGWACTDGAYAVTLSTRPYSPVIVTVAFGSCDTPTMCYGI